MLKIKINHCLKRRIRYQIEMETLPEESELWCFSERANIVHDMTELVEVSLDLVVVKQSWLVGCGLTEVCHHGTD